MVKTVKLDSGVRLVLEKIDYVRSAAVGIWVKAGACCENRKNAGISHYIEHMMFKGTSNRTARQIAEDIDRIGGQINAFTGKEATCYYVKSTGENYKAASDVLIDMLTNTLLDPADMKKERDVIREEIRMNADDPDDLAHETVTSLVFKGSPLGNSILGTYTSLGRISGPVMKKYIDGEYTRDSIVISVAGNFDEEDAVQYFNDKLLTLSEKKESVKPDIPEYVPGFRCITRDIEQAHLCMATKSISLDDDRYYAVSILNNIMGGSMSSRLFQNIREEKGLAYSVYSMLGCFSHDGYFNIYAGVNPERIDLAVEGILEELDSLERKGVTKEELDSSREQMKSSYIFGLENVSGRMFKNGKGTLLLDHIYSEDEVMAGFDSVTLDDIDMVKSLVSNPDNYSAAVVTKKPVNIRKMMRG